MTRVGKVAKVGHVRKVKGLETVAGLKPEQPGVKGHVWADPLTRFLHQASAKLEMQRRRAAQDFPMGPSYLRGSQHCPDVNSSAIADVAYNNALGRLTVKFNTGRTYDYFNVSNQRYQAFCDADSKGRYFNQNIRHAYAYTRRG